MVYCNFVGFWQAEPTDHHFSQVSHVALSTQEADPTEIGIAAGLLSATTDTGSSLWIRLQEHLVGIPNARHQRNGCCH